MITTHQLSKTYRTHTGKVTALESVSVSIPRGITGIIGPNGSGKSTLLRLLTSVERPTTGTIELDGQPITGKFKRDYRRAIGYVPQDVTFVPSMTVTQALEYAGWVSGMTGKACRKRIPEALDMVELGEKARSKVGGLSGGQNRRLGIAAATIHAPDIVLFDEPTAGLDPQARVGIRNIIELLGHDSTVVVSSHLADDISRLSKQIVALRRGAVAFTGEWDELLHAAKNSEHAIDSSDPLEIVLGFVADSHSTLNRRPEA